MRQPDTVTRLLEKGLNGERAALDELAPLVYTQLREIAGREFGRKFQDQLMQPTALAHEAWIRIVDQPAKTFESRSHLYAWVSRLIRNILVDHARRSLIQDVRPLAEEGSGLEPGRDDRVLTTLAIHEALEKLDSEDERLAMVVELRFFGGLTVDETCDVMGTSASTVTRDWRFARAWLQKELQQGSSA